MRGNEAANKPFPSSAYGCAIMIRLPSNHESHHHSRTLAICMPVFRRFLSRAVHPRFEPIRVVKSSTPRNGSKWNESVESGSRSIMDNAFEVNDSCYSSPQISKFRETREKKCRIYSIDLLLFSPEPIQPLPFIGQLSLESSSDEKLVFPKASRIPFSNAPRLITR